MYKFTIYNSCFFFCFCLAIFYTCQAQRLCWELRRGSKGLFRLLISSTSPKASPWNTLAVNHGTGVNLELHTYRPGTAALQ